MAVPGDWFDAMCARATKQTFLPPDERVTAIQTHRRPDLAIVFGHEFASRPTLSGQRDLSAVRECV